MTEFYETIPIKETRWSMKIGEVFKASKCMKFQCKTKDRRTWNCALMAPLFHWCQSGRKIIKHADNTKMKNSRKELVCVAQSEKDQKACIKWRNSCSNEIHSTDNKLYRWEKAQTGKNTGGVLRPKQMKCTLHKCWHAQLHKLLTSMPKWEIVGILCFYWCQIRNQHDVKCETRYKLDVKQ